MADRRTILPAATIVLARPEMQLLFLRRHPAASAFAGAYVFPGGRLEQGDLDGELWQRVQGLSAEEADQRLNLTVGALSYWVAAVRECYEESGMLLAVDRSGQTLPARRVASLVRMRDALNRHELSFKDFLLQEDLYIPGRTIVYFAHWITPPVHPQRFDTRFFVAQAPPDQQVTHDNTETVESCWMQPAEVLSRVKNNAMPMVRATQAIVEDLGKFSASADALAQLRTVSPILTNRPAVAQGREGQRYFRQGDAIYAEVRWSDPDESGATTYDMLADEPKRLDRYVTRVLAPNPGFMTGPGTNSYLVGENELIAIDPGPADPGHTDALLKAAAGRLRLIVLTHTHRDHSPGALALHEATGAPIAGRAADAGSVPDAHVPLHRVLTDGDLVTVDGAQLQVLHTPGHASNHLCYLLTATGMLFTGDHVIQGSTVVISPPDGNMNAYLRSLQRVNSLEVAIFAPGHGYLIGQPHSEVLRLIAHRMSREAKVRTALSEAGGSATLETLLPRVYDDVPAAVHPVAARSLRAHLEKLAEDGVVGMNGDVWASRAVR